jgi:hypothetical protein
MLAVALAVQMVVLLLEVLAVRVVAVMDVLVAMH